MHHLKIKKILSPKIVSVVAMCRGVGTAASIVVRVNVRVRAFGGSGGLKNTRIIKGTQRFILVQANRCPMSSS